MDLWRLNLFERLNLYGESGKHNKLIIILFSVPILCIIYTRKDADYVKFVSEFTVRWTSE
jgi:hypothetical protein